MLKNSQICTHTNVHTHPSGNHRKSRSHIVPVVTSISNSQTLASKFHRSLKETIGEIASLGYLVSPEIRKSGKTSEVRGQVKELAERDSQ